jgi:uncharacterized LabA/DUF88 family protein
MVFIDYENFEIARQKIYKTNNPNDARYQAPWLDLVKFPRELVRKVSPEFNLTKTFLFVPEPDDFLKTAPWRKKKYDFLKGLGTRDFFTVISGRHVARPVAGYTHETMDIDDKKTYFIDEKGTDVNMAVQMLTKAYHNAYDTAIIVSADTDYIPVCDILNTIGKTVVVVGVKGQQLPKFRSCSDKQVFLGLDFLQKCERPSREE